MWHTISQSTEIKAIWMAEKYTVYASINRLIFFLNEVELVVLNGHPYLPQTLPPYSILNSERNNCLHAQIYAVMQLVHLLRRPGTYVYIYEFPYVYMLPDSSYPFCSSTYAHRGYEN